MQIETPPKRVTLLDDELIEAVQAYLTAKGVAGQVENLVDAYLTKCSTIGMTDRLVGRTTFTLKPESEA